jgi:hypothetical protein
MSPILSKILSFVLISAESEELEELMKKLSHNLHEIFVVEDFQDSVMNFRMTKSNSLNLMFLFQRWAFTCNKGVFYLIT